MLESNMKIVKEVIKDLKALSNPEKEEVFKRFFKTGKGEYGYGDIFWGITVPNTRKVAKRYYKDISMEECTELLHSPIHEVRLTSLHMLVYKYKRATGELREDIVEAYLNNLEYVNNWDLVDLSCYKILGDYLLNNPLKREILYTLVKSNNLWKQRVAVVSCLALIRDNEFDDILKLSYILLSHEHDLMHKAVGWMLREVGKRDMDVLRRFLDINVNKMPRTMLRYSIERMDEVERKRYLRM
jgi:3-methyladenine DNA glycosylase AlkD